MAETIPPDQMPPPRIPSEATPPEFEARRQLRAELGGYLDKTERSIDAMNLMLEDGLLDLILGPHRLLRAIKYRPDEKAALNLLASFGDAAPIVLSAGDFPAFAEAAFGRDCALKAALGKVSVGPPPQSLSLLRDAELAAPEQPQLPAAPPLETQGTEDPEPKWWRPSWIARKEAAKAAVAKGEADEKKHAQALEYHRLLILPDEHHHYIDSFMDWVGETLEPSTNPPDPGVEALMHQYKNPRYVIGLARADYDEVLEVKAKAARDIALDYHKVAALVDRQDIAAFASLLPSLLRAEDGSKEQLLRDLLLIDFGVVSFAEMALNKVESRDDQLLLFREALRLEPEFRLTGLSSRGETLERVLREVTAPSDPLGKEALNLALEKLRRHPDETAYDIMGLKKGSPNPLARLLDSLGGGLLALVGALLGVSPQDRDNARRRRQESSGEGRHAVQLRRQLGNRVFEETFDFAARTCVTQVRDGGGDVEARRTENFSDIQDKARLREAFTAYARKGGTLSEAEVFSGPDGGEKSRAPRNPSYGRRRQHDEPIG